MLDKAKAFNKARKMKADMEKQLEQIFHLEEKGENSVLIRGDKRIEKIVLFGQERKDIKELLNSAVKSLDKKIEKKMRDQAGDIMEMLGLKS